MIATTHNRWLVAFSVASIALLAVAAGGCRLFLERITSEWEMRTSVIPSPLAPASLGVIALLFVITMAANVGLLLYPLETRGGKISAVLAGICVASMAILSCGFGISVLQLLGRSHLL